MSEAWSRVTKNAIAETIIALTKMEEEYRSPVRCIATTRVRTSPNLALVHCKCVVGAHSGTFLYVRNTQVKTELELNVHLGDLRNNEE